MPGYQESKASIAQALSEVESLSVSRPHEEAWLRMGQLLLGMPRRGWPRQWQDVLAPLAGWPREIRIACPSIEAYPSGVPWWNAGARTAEAPWLRYVARILASPAEIRTLPPDATLRAQRLDDACTWCPDMIEDLGDVAGALGVIKGIVGLQIERVALPGKKHGEPRWELLFRAPCASRLRSLRLDYCLFGGEAAVILPSSPLAASLEELRLRGCDARAALGPMLESWPSTPPLRRLDIAANAVPASAMTRWRGRPWVGRLQALDVSGNRVELKDVQRLLGGTATALQRLGIGGIPMTADGADWLAGSDDLAQLRALHVPLCSITDEVFARLCDSVLFARLEEIDLSSNNLTEESVHALVRRPRPQNLSRLHIGDNPLDDGTIGELERWLGPETSAAASLLSAPRLLLDGATL